MRRGLDAQGRGALIVKVNVPSVVFLDEIPRSQDANGARIADLVAGEYRLLVQSADEPTSFRYYKVPVYAHQITRLDVSWELDSVLVTGDWVGFQFDTSLQQSTESEAAFRVAKDTSANAVVTLRIEVNKQSKMIEASFYELKQQKKTCAGRVRLNGRATDGTYVTGLARVLGKCLASSQAARGVINVTKSEETGGAVTVPTSSSSKPVNRRAPADASKPELPWVPDDPPPSKPNDNNAPAAAARKAPARTAR